MKRIKNYNKFYINDILLESVLKADPEFYRIIKMMYNKDITYASRLNDWIRWESDIETNYNFLRPSKDKNDEIEFIPDRQASKLSTEEGFTKKPNLSKIGRFIRQIMTAQNVKVSDENVEKFVNAYKSTWDLLYSNTSDRIRIIEGEEIRKWYDQNNYQSSESGELGNSCMRSSSKSGFFGIYENNPGVVKMVIFLDDEDRLLGRSLWWKLSESEDGNEYYLDRIYTRYESDKEIISNWIEKKFPNSKIGYYKNKNKKMSVKLENVDFEQYPYVDTFCYLYKDDKTISNTKDLNYDGELYEMSSTGGSVDLINHVKCKFEDELVLIKNTYYSYAGYYLKKENGVKSKLYESDNDNKCWVHKDDAIYSKYYDSIISNSFSRDSKKYGKIPYEKSRTVYLKLDEDGDVDHSVYDFYPDDLLNKEFFKYNGVYYDKDLGVITDDDEFIPRSLAAIVYIDSDHNYYSDLDVYLFDIDTSKMRKANIDKNDYIRQYYEDGSFDYDVLISKLDSITNKDIEKIEEKRKEASEFHFNELFSSYTYRKNYIIKKYSSVEGAIERLHELTNSIISENKDTCDRIIDKISDGIFEEIEDLLKRYDEIDVRDIIKIDIDELSLSEIKKFINSVFEKYLAFYLSRDLSKYWNYSDFERINDLEYNQYVKESFLTAMRHDEFDDFLEKLRLMLEDNKEEIKLIVAFLS